MSLASAHQAWDERWNDDAIRSRWLEPVESVRRLVPLLRARYFSRVLDLGCGIGRHAHYLASEGFECVAIDASESGLSFARERAKKEGRSIDYRNGTFYALDLADRCVDAVIAWNVIYHGDRDVVQRAVSEIARVLVPGGLYVGSILSKRNIGYGSGREVRPDTFVVDDATDDKVHPHFYADATGVLDLHRGAFDLLELRDHEQAPGAHHWEFTFERV